MMYKSMHKGLCKNLDIEGGMHKISRHNARYGDHGRSPSNSKWTSIENDEMCCMRPLKDAKPMGYTQGKMNAMFFCKRKST